MNKNKLLSGLAALAIGLTTSCTTIEKSPKISLENYLEKVPGYKVELRPENPTIYLIHIKQTHHVRPSDGEPISPEQIEEIRKFSFEDAMKYWDLVRAEYFEIEEKQEKIHELLLKFNDIGNTNIFVESQLIKKTRNELISDYLSELNELVFYKIIQENEKADLYLLPGAAQYLAIEGICNVMPAESKELLDKTDEAFTRLGPNNPEVIKLNNQREDYLISLIKNSKSDFPITLYGSEHDFIDNLVRNNEENPKKQIGLIVYED